MYLVHIVALQADAILCLGRKKEECKRQELLVLSDMGLADRIARFDFFDPALSTFDLMVIKVF